MNQAASANYRSKKSIASVATLMRGGCFAALAVFASACVPTNEPPVLTSAAYNGAAPVASGVPVYDATITASYVEAATPFEAVGSLQTGGVSQNNPGRAALEIRRTMSAMPGLEGTMIDGESIGASPRPWLEFCRKNPSRTQCASEPVAVDMNEARLHQLMAAQDMVHQSTRQRPDAANIGDQWELIDQEQSGDREDMALTKRDILMTWGWPAGSLRPAICVINRDGTAETQLHAVLTVDTSDGTYVLGNLVDGVRTISNSECSEWVMRSDGIHWSWIEGGSTIPLRPVSAKR